MTSEYSIAEQQLFDFFGYGDLTKCSSIVAPTLYRMCVEKAFLENIQGPEVEALRRAACAVRECKPYRMTPEFDALLVF